MQTDRKSIMWFQALQHQYIATLNNSHQLHIQPILQCATPWHVRWTRVSILRVASVPICLWRSDGFHGTQVRGLDKQHCVSHAGDEPVVSIQNVTFNSDSYLQMQLKLFPQDGVHFNRTEIVRIGYDLCSRTGKPPSGMYHFIASPYPL